jgi:hypothetical protein
VILLKITLADAVHLKSLIGKQIQELISERHSVSSVIIKKGDTIPSNLNERTMEEVTEELNDVRDDYRELSLLLAELNFKNTVIWNGESIPLTAALELSKQLRGEVNELKNFGRKKKEGLHSSWGNDDSYEITNYEPRDYKEKANKLERQVNKLSSDINNKNYNTYLDFNSASKYF